MHAKAVFVNIFQVSMRTMRTMRVGGWSHSLCRSFCVTRLSISSSSSSSFSSSSLCVSQIYKYSFEVWLTLKHTPLFPHFFLIYSQKTKATNREPKNPRARACVCIYRYIRWSRSGHMYALIIYTRRGFKSCSSRSSVFFFLSALKKCERRPGMEVVKAHRAR